MVIRLGKGCKNCENLVENDTCKVHGVKESSNYTCDSLKMKDALQDNGYCTTCSC